MEELKKAHQSQDLAAIDSAMEGINKAWEGAAQEMYAASGGDAAGADAQAGAADAGTAGSADDVADVEYEEVDDDKK